MRLSGCKRRERRTGERTARLTRSEDGPGRAEEGIAAAEVSKNDERVTRRRGEGRGRADRLACEGLRKCALPRGALGRPTACRPPPRGRRSTCCTWRRSANPPKVTVQLHEPGRDGRYSSAGEGGHVDSNSRNELHEQGKWPPRLWPLCLVLLNALAVWASPLNHLASSRSPASPKGSTQAGPRHE